MPNCLNPPPPTFVYLASQSPRRRELLEQLGVTHRLLLPDDAEAAEALEDVALDDTPQTYVTRVALAKGFAARARHDALRLAVAPIVAADTTVTIDGEILGKPTDGADAARMLERLSGRTHQVLTGVAVLATAVSERSGTACDHDAGTPALTLARAAQRAIHRGSDAAPATPLPPPPGRRWHLAGVKLLLSVSTVRMRALDARDIGRYIASDEPFGKAGAYGIQGRGAEFIAELHGSYSGVMGLPLFETAAALRETGLIF